jgi:hypothetical protein
MADLLVHDHAEVGALLSELARAFERGAGAGEILTRLDYVWARLAVHIRAEHLHLFPALLGASERRGDDAAAGTPTPEEVRAAVERLREDHDFFMRELAGAVNAARALAAADDHETRTQLRHLESKVRAVAERLEEHNRLEEGQVYLWPGALLSDEGRAALQAGMAREVENLPPRFNDGRGAPV